MNIDLAPLDYLKEQNILFCIVCRGDVLTTDTFHSFNKWATTATQMGIKYLTETIADNDEAKNNIAQEFITMPGPTHLLFLDADVTFNPWHILALLSAQKHIIGCNGLAHDHHVDMALEGDLREVTRITDSFMLMTRDALVHLGGQLYSDEIALCDRWREGGGSIWSHDQVKIKTS